MPYELQRGTFYAVTSQRETFRMIETRLPSTTNLNASYTTTPNDLQSVDITVDSSQDLLVMLDLTGRYVMLAIPVNRSPN